MRLTLSEYLEIEARQKAKCSAIGKIVDRSGDKPRLRQRITGLNKTETEFHDHLKGMGYPHIYAQGITLKIGNGVRYTPDFVCVSLSGTVRAYEVKGFMRDDAAVKIKVAASLYPWIKFNLAWKTKGLWHFQEIFP